MDGESKSQSRGLGAIEPRPEILSQPQTLSSGQAPFPIDEDPMLPDGEFEEPLIPESFDRTASPTSAKMRNKGAEYEKVGETGVCKMHRYSLYETASRYYLVGGDVMDRKYRILKIDRTVDSGGLLVSEDEIVYTKKEMNQLLNAVDDGNKSTGGLKLRCTTWGLLGFIKFTGAFYMLLITKRSQVALVGGHYIYQIDGTELVSLTTASSTRFKIERNPEEGRFVSILHNLDLSRSFYFSYSYDITNTLQHNIQRERHASGEDLRASPHSQFNDMFVWNHHLLEPAVKSLKNTYDWCLPIVHGFVDQATLSIYGRTVYITIIARRSRFFAGARFLKRGANDMGYVANDVETEQIVSEMLTTSFHAPGPVLYANPNYTSYVQHRGSIPLYWTQDSTGVTPKPDIELNLVDPFYSAAARHFDNLFKRYGAPVYVLNLIKSRERTPRESILLKEFTNAINYLNQFLPIESKIIYKAWDMSRASKSRDQDVIVTLESIAEDVLKTTGFFHNGNNGADEVQVQNGIARTNCIDCLDRTNAAQFVIGKLALGHQLHALGCISGTSVEYDTDVVNLFTHMYHDHGDTIAIQYGGSHLVNTMETYRKINQWTSQPRDMVESFKRYYHNSFLDGQRQEAYNLFLGNYTFAQGQPMLWDLSTDYYLHHTNPRSWSINSRRNYIEWFDPENLKRRTMVPTVRQNNILEGKPLDYFDDYWYEYYRPLAASSFLKLFSFRMNSTLKYIHSKPAQESRHDLSPFKVRETHEHETADKTRLKKEVKISEDVTVAGLPVPSNVSSSRPGLVQGGSTADGLNIEQMGSTLLPGAALNSPLLQHQSDSADPNHRTQARKKPKDKAAIAQWTFNQFAINSLNPSVTASETAEYGRYINHPLNLPLVVSSELPQSPSLEFLSYVNSVSLDAISDLHSTTDDLADYVEFLDVAEDPLTVTEADTPKKRYKAYRQWLKGKSLFKQQRIDA
ncbi:phosphatidylinositol-3,5-bisphosphate 5-phosphatase [Bachmanniomyces sp. S44760]|nr:phosphatidylinositol-3,5-bisphosphate 5-phosphatase [Bachmanniomyces sp. S44760]